MPTKFQDLGEKMGWVARRQDSKFLPIKIDSPYYRKVQWGKAKPRKGTLSSYGLLFAGLISAVLAGGTVFWIRASKRQAD
jgi:hypothetical protein